MATCMINKWMAKINGEEIYNTRGPPRIGERKGRRREIKRRMVAVLTTPESFRS